jgi:hypothetical protein
MRKPALRRENSVDEAERRRKDKVGRTYLIINRGRDGDEFCSGLGATTAVYALYSKEKQRHPGRQVQLKTASRPMKEFLVH